MFRKMIKDVMTSPVACVSSSATAGEVAQKMRDEDIGAVAVCEGERCVGIVTDRDIVIRASAQGKDFACSVSEIMSKEPVHCYEDQSLKEAEKLMEDHQIRRLLVYNRAGTLRGIVTLSDIVGVDRGMTGRILEKVSRPYAGLTGH